MARLYQDPDGSGRGCPRFHQRNGRAVCAHIYLYGRSRYCASSYPGEVVSETLNEEHVDKILKFLVVQRHKTDYLYYTASQPGNPLFDRPILDVGDGMYQAFEEKQVIHAIKGLLERVCSSTKAEETKYVTKKGNC
jgi:hypothetical protein